MLLAEILNQRAESSAVLLRRNLYANDEQSDLVRDVLALANSATGDIRHLLFGAEQTGAGVKIAGLDRPAVDRLRSLGDGLADLIEPALRVSPILAEVDGKQVAGLEIRGCGNPPYTLRQRIAEDMRTGACWVRDLEDVRPARREDLDKMYARHEMQPMVPVEIGLRDDPACLQLRLDVPDTSKPPSQQARAQLLSAINAKKAANQVLCDDDTGLARLAHARIFGADTPYVQRGMDTLIEQLNGTNDGYEHADLHYFYEQQALKLPLTICNRQPAPLENIEIEFSLPQVPGFEVAERLHSDPNGHQSVVESRLAGYPEVKKGPDRATVRIKLGSLAPGQSQAVFETPLRIRLGPQMRGMKVAVRYRLSATGLQETQQGRLKLVFRA